MRRRILSLGLLVVMLASCTSTPSSVTQAPAVSLPQQNQVSEVVPEAGNPQSQPALADPTATSTLPSKSTLTSEPAGAPAATATTAPTATPAKPAESAAPAASSVGPDEFPSGVNPLTGLPAADPSTLALSPALVSVTNFPITARPQAGLSYTPMVFELYIGEGMTRFLAMFYGSFPEEGAGEQNGVSGTNDGIGPIRSGRLPYESLRRFYNGFLVMASASSNVTPLLKNYVNVWGSDENNINSALISVSKIKEIAGQNGDKLDSQSLVGMKFDAHPSVEGKPARSMFLAWSYLNQVMWRYDEASGSYLRWQDNADGATFTQMTDRLNGDPLQYSNVVVLFAQHRPYAETLIDVDLSFISRGSALLFRDGQVSEIYWSTTASEYEKKTGNGQPIRFIDDKGSPVALKPGQTWVEIVPPYTPVYESVEPGTYFDKATKTSPGSGDWVVNFNAFWSGKK